MAQAEVPVGRYAREAICTVGADTALVGEGFVERLFELHDLDVCGAVSRVGVLVDQVAGLRRQVQAVIFRDIDADAQRDVVPTAGKVLEVQPHFVDMAVTVDLLFAGDPVAIEVKSHTGSGLGKPAYLVELVDQMRTIDALCGAKVKVI